MDSLLNDFESMIKYNLILMSIDEFINSCCEKCLYDGCCPSSIADVCSVAISNRFFDFCK